jgi:glucose/arabinose dehydrogenase
VLRCLVGSRAAAVALLLAAPAARAVVAVPDGFVNENLLGGLDQPNAMAFLPDGRLLFTEQRTGNVRLVVNGHIASTDPVLTVPELQMAGYEQGLQGVAVDPGWPARPYVYLYYNRLGNFCRLVRYTASGSVTSSIGDNVTLGNPLLLIDDIPDNNPNHNSGCLRFGPDGMLYVSLGEDEDRCAAQDSTALKGQILRLDVSGLGAGGGGPVARDSITAAGNPLATTDPNAKLVWAYGLRNPWRFHPDPESALLYGIDVGEDRFEEVNEIAAGDDLGWPYREGFFVSTYCPEPGGPGVNHYKDPIYAYDRQSMPASTAFVGAGIYRTVSGRTANWPASYDGDVFYAEYYRGWLRRLHKTGSTWAPGSAAPGQPNATDWATGLISAVDFLTAPDGSMWWLSQFDASMSGTTGTLNRIRFIAPSDTDTMVVTPGPLLIAFPNPFATTTSLSLGIPSTREVTLSIFDLSGRRVRTFHELAGASRQILWDGTDDRGEAVPSGVYLARLEGRGISATARILRVR